MCVIQTHIPTVHTFGPRWQRQADLSKLEVNTANSSEAEYAWALLSQNKTSLKNKVRPYFTKYDEEGEEKEEEEEEEDWQDGWAS